MELVADMKIRVEFRTDLVYRYTFESSNTPGEYGRRKPREDVWAKEKTIGQGSFGSVWLHRCLNDQTQLQAVKMVSKQDLARGPSGIDYNKELEAIAKFSLPKVRYEITQSLLRCLSP